MRSLPSLDTLRLVVERYTKEANRKRLAMNCTIRDLENARGENRQNIKANRGCDAAKGIQYGFVAQLAGLNFSPANPKGCILNSSSFMRGAFL